MKPPAEAVVDLYDRRARDFDADRTKTLFERPWLDAFLDHVPPAGMVLDLGCGSGEPIARHVIEQGRRVTGVDAAPGLVELCRSRFPGHRWIAADITAVKPNSARSGIQDHAYACASSRPRCASSNPQATASNQSGRQGW